MEQDKYDLFLRQIDILDVKVCSEPIIIIGAGATGSFTALSLAKMGFDNIRVFDEDTLELHNFPNQIYPQSMIGNNKAKALKEVVKMFTGVEITGIPVFYKSQPLKGIVISALDTMAGRKEIYDNCVKQGNTKLIIDPRTGPEVFRVLTVDLSLSMEREAYEKTLYTDENAEEAPCTARSIIYSVLVVSAFVAKQVKAYLMNQEYKRDIVVDLSADFMLTK